MSAAQFVLVLSRDGEPDYCHARDLEKCLACGRDMQLPSLLVTDEDADAHGSYCAACAAESSWSVVTSVFEHCGGGETELYFEGGDESRYGIGDCDRDTLAGILEILGVVFGAHSNAPVWPVIVERPRAVRSCDDGSAADQLVGAIEVLARIS